MDTLTAAQRKAVDISVALATMKRPSEIIPAVDELLEILTGEKALMNVPMFKQIQPPPTPPPVSETKTVILSVLEKNKSSMTPYRICKETGLTEETVKKTLSELLGESKVTSLKKRGPTQYVRVYQNTRS